MNLVVTPFERGDGENFYIHSFCHYVPHMMQKLYYKRCLGLGDMTMEGFGHKDFSNKHVLYNQLNGKVNVTLQSMKVMNIFSERLSQCAQGNQKRVNSDEKESNSTTNNQVDFQKVINTYLVEEV